jgi:hypothetical protein
VFARPIISAVVAVVFLPALAHAAASSALAVAKPGGGQLGLAAGFTTEGQLRAAVCTAEPCSLDKAVPIPVPDAAAKLAGTARLRIVRVGAERKAIVVEIPDPSTPRVWTALLVPPLGGATPLVPFSGYTGLTEGTEDEPSGPMLLVRDGAVYVGTQRLGYDLCGRPTILAPQVLDPSTLTLKPAKVQRLDDAERAAAPILVARPAEGPAAPPLLHALWATSAAPGAPASALSDGNLETAWAEGRGGAGRGELVVLNAPSAVPLIGFDIALPARKAPHAAVPRDVWLVTEHQVFRVNLPEAPAAEGARFAVTLPVPVTTACVSLVLDEASSNEPDAAVAVAELAARPALRASKEELVRALAGGGPDAEAAGGILRASGPEALTDVATAFATLDEGGRRVALDVLDDAPCPIATPVYVAALIGPYDAQRLHARRALERCPADASVAFEAVIAKATTKERVVLAEELSSVAPATAVRVLVPLLAKANVVERRAYRSAIGRAAQTEEARASVVAALDDPNVKPLVTVDVLRALTTDLPAFGDSARRAFGRVFTPVATFRTRFLLLGPAAELAATDAGARGYVQRALTTEPDARIRAEAARILRDPSPYKTELSRLLDDAQVRVRESAVTALGLARADEARERMVYVMEHDPWPLVRVASARAVAGLSPGRPVDEALGRAVEDPSDDVRRAALRAVGTRRATADLGVVRDRFEDADELPGVRAEAALSLGMLCDVKSLNALTEFARVLASPTAEDSQRLIGRGSLAALALIHPADLEKRIAPLRDKKVPVAIRLFAQTALRTPGRCAVVMPAAVAPRAAMKPVAPPPVVAPPVPAPK